MPNPVPLTRGWPKSCTVKWNCTDVCRNENSLRAMVSARPPCRIRCLNTSRLHSNYSTVVSHDTTVFLLTKNSCTPAGAQDRSCRLALLYLLPIGSFPILLSAYNQNAATAVPAARRAAEIFCTKARALGPSPWTQTESACRVTVLPSSACTVPYAAICKTRAMAVSSSSIIAPGAPRGTRLTSAW